MPSFRTVDAGVFERRQVKAAPKVAPEIAYMARKIAIISDASLVYEVVLEDGEKANTVRQRIQRASKVAGVEVAVRRAPRGGWFVGLMTPERRSRVGRRPKQAG